MDYNRQGVWLRCRQHWVSPLSAALIEEGESDGRRRIEPDYLLSFLSFSRFNTTEKSLVQAFLKPPLPAAKSTFLPPRLRAHLHAQFLVLAWLLIDLQPSFALVASPPGLKLFSEIWWAAPLPSRETAETLRWAEDDLGWVRKPELDMVSRMKKKKREEVPAVDCMIGVRVEEGEKKKKSAKLMLLCT